MIFTHMCDSKWWQWSSNETANSYCIHTAPFFSAIFSIYFFILCSFNDWRLFAESERVTWWYWKSDIKTILFAPFKIISLGSLVIWKKNVNEQWQVLKIAANTNPQKMAIQLAIHEIGKFYVCKNREFDKHF